MCTHVYVHGVYAHAHAHAHARARGGCPLNARAAIRRGEGGGVRHAKRSCRSMKRICDARALHAIPKASPEKKKKRYWDSARRREHHPLSRFTYDCRIAVHSSNGNDAQERANACASQSPPPPFSSSLPPRRVEVKLPLLLRCLRRPSVPLLVDSPFRFFYVLISYRKIRNPEEEGTRVPMKR